MAPVNAYRERLIHLVGGRDPLEVLGETAQALAEIVPAHRAEVLHARPFEGKWTPAEIIGHLCDSEWVYGFRLRLILSENNPPIAGTQQDAWVVGLRYRDRAPAELAEEFRGLRELNLAQWRRLSAEQLRRCGQHSERGAEPLFEMLPILAGHDLNHLDQIRRYIQAVQRGG